MMTTTIPRTTAVRPPWHPLERTDGTGWAFDGSCKTQYMKADNFIDNICDAPEVQCDADDVVQTLQVGEERTA
jgi:hypothetical protein